VEGAKSLVLDRWRLELLCVLLLPERIMRVRFGKVMKAVLWPLNGIVDRRSRDFDEVHVMYISIDDQHEYWQVSLPLC
jgi:hypothetical protein